MLGHEQVQGIKINKTDRPGSGTDSARAGNKKIIACTESWLGANSDCLLFTRGRERARQQNYKSQLYKFFERTRKKLNAKKVIFHNERRQKNRGNHSVSAEADTTLVYM